MKQWWPRFSLRALFLLVTLCAICLSWYRWGRTTYVGEVRYVDPRSDTLWFRLDNVEVSEVGSTLRVRTQKARPVVITVNRVLGTDMVEARIDYTAGRCVPITPGEAVTTPSRREQFFNRFKSNE